ncbi:hypothetical protein HUJ04_007963 [Dendroctonus ponderosae]|nr:hypothetical protein HUJ04_007963 [Dendroctonus ponderosae]
MTSVETVGTVVLKFLKLAINIICLYLYRTGSDGTFLGVGGTWNMAENKNADAEIFASGIFIGYFIYTFISLVALCFAAGDHKNTFTDILMNIVGVFLWIAVGATALHYWHGYLSEHKYTYVNSERQHSDLRIEMYTFDNSLDETKMQITLGALKWQADIDTTNLHH